MIFTGARLAHHHGYGEQAQLVLWNPQLFLGVAVGTLAVVALGSGFKTLELAQGGSAVATMLGGRLVDPDHHRPGRAQAAERRRGNGPRLRHAGAAGLCACPRRQGINAFAAGHSTSDAVVGRHARVP